MSDTPRLSLPLLAAGQAQKHVTHNDALMLIDALVHLSVVTRGLSAPPALPEENKAWLIGAAPSGAWAGRADQIALREDAGWTFLVPRAGWQAYVEDEALPFVFTGTHWRRATPIDAEGAALWGVNGAADATTRLVVKSPASLFQGDGGDHRLKVSKQAEGGTASIIFQTAFSGRAELGLAGDDRFAIKVSADGDNWTQALTIDQATGEVSFPATAPAGSANLLINGDLMVNQRSFVGGTLAAGSYGFDRWRAAPGGAHVSRLGSAVTLASGGIEQVVEPACWGRSDLALSALTLSVENLSGASLAVTIGSASGTIMPGPGRRSVTLTTSSGDTGALTVRLTASGSAAVFGRVRLDAGALAGGWTPRPMPEELALCRRYYVRLPGQIRLDAYQLAGGSSRHTLVLPTAMRVTPTPTFTVITETNSDPAQRGAFAISPSHAYANVVAVANGRVVAIIENVAFSAEY